MKKMPELSKTRYPGLVRLAELFKSNHRFAGDLVERGYALFGDPWAQDFEHVLNSFFSEAPSLADAAKGYSVFAMQSMRLQAVFERERRYKEKTHAQASSEVYFNDDHMMKEYLPGLLLSHFLWSHHYRQLRFFQSAFVEPMRVAGAASFAEVGVGTGLYSGVLLRELPEIQGVGFDISPSSKRFAERHMQALGVSDRYCVELRDVTVESCNSLTDWLICVEVLEHLDDPVAFLRGLRRNMAPGGKAFVTAALNSAHADHIYLYRTGEEVRAHLNEAGFVIEQSFGGLAYKPPRAGVPVPEAAAFIVY